jgi:DNA replication protein DnaC
MSVADKKEIVKATVKKEHGCDSACIRCAKIHRLIDEMFEANIPVGYWFLTMKDFQGAPKLKEIYEKYVDSLRDKYMEGKSLCFAGNQGTGKTMSSICILKEAIKRGFSTYYTTASDILNYMTDYKNNNELRHRLRNTDFLVIDELDSRFFTSDSVRELFSGIYENVFRYRAHNMMPTIICTNETEGVSKIFHGAGVQSIESLNHQYLIVHPVVGQDFRKRQV